MSEKISFPEGASTVSFQVEDDSFWYLNRNLWIRSFVSKWGPFKDFVDVGGGNGYIAKMLQDSFSMNVTLVEPGEEATRNAKKRGVSHVLKGTIQSFPELQAVDAIGLFDVLEHIEQPVDFLKMIHSRLNKNGKVFITVPAYMFLWSNEDVFAGHFRRYTKQSLKTELESAGFKVLKSSYFFAPLLPLIFLFRALPYKLGKTDLGDHQGEHTPKLSTAILSFVLKLEFSLCMLLNFLPAGSSIILVAQKKA